MLTFYFSPGSSSMAAHIALHEVGATFDLKPLSFAKKEHQTSAFRAINPAGKVPALLIDGRLLTEVAGILFYLARRFPEARLLPEDIEGQAQVVSWMSFIASSIHPVNRKPDQARAIYKLVDQRLGDNEWTVGGCYSIADIHLFRLFWRFRGAVDPSPGEFPSIERHYERVMARPAVQKTIAIESQIGYELPA